MKQKVGNIMRVCAISDIHGNLDFQVKETDLLICAGDTLPSYRGGRDFNASLQSDFLEEKFYPWVRMQPAENIVMISGNHDWIFENHSHMVPKMPSNLHYLQDSEIEIDGLKIYGTPHQPIFYNWAFNQSSRKLKMYFDNIPENLDILISHTPPYGMLDEILKYGGEIEHGGCKILRDAIIEKKPRYVISGHFHSRWGIIRSEEFKNTTFINASLLDEQYNRVKDPIYIEIENNK